MTTTTSSKTPLIVLAGCLGSCLVGTGLVAAFMVGGGGAMLAPSPIAGSRNVLLTFTSPDGDGGRDAVAMVERLEALRVDAVVDEAGPGRIVLRVDDVRSGADVVEIVAPRRHLAFHIVDDEATAFSSGSMASPPAGTSPVQDGARGYVGGPPALVVELIAGATLAAGRTARVHCLEAAPGAPPQCYPMVLEVPAIVTGEHVSRAEAEASPNSWGAQVMLSFDGQGTRLFAAGTAANVGRRMAIVVDERVLSAPVIQSAIDGGRAQVTMGSSDDAEAQMYDAELLAAALSGGHSLSATWEFAEVQLVP